MSHLYAFGAYRLYPDARVLQNDEGEIPLGGRAFDVLLSLVKSQGKVLSHRQLMAAAWPGLVVEHSNVRVQIASLRRSLGGEQGNGRYIVSVAGRGYCFAAAVERLVFDEPIESHPGADEAALESSRAKPGRPASRLPPPLHRAIGRSACVAELAELVEQNRLVTVVGGGGTGKTTLAVLTGHAAKGYDAIIFVDLSSVHREEMVLEALASSLDHGSSHAALLPGVLDVLSEQKILILMDNCEHVIDSVAALCHELVEHCVGVHLLLTSREALRVMGERVYLLQPLGFPPESLPLSAGDAARWPAVRLFLERAVASGGSSDLSDQDATRIAGLCRRLDGNPLAIGLVASQVGVYGIQGVVDLIASQFALHWQGQRDAPRRQRSVGATIDWTYALLPERDRFVLSCLSVFVGSFSWSAAIDVVADDRYSGFQVAAAIDELVNKFLVSVIEIKGRSCVSLLETTRAFASAKLDRSPFGHAVCQRHANHYLRLLQSAQSLQPHGRQAEQYLDANDMSNVQAAIEWGLEHEGGLEQAVEMVRLAVPLFLDNLRCGNCERRWSPSNWSAPGA